MHTCSWYGSARSAALWETDRQKLGERRRRKEEKRRGRRKTQTKGLQSTEEEELATLKALLLKGMVQKRERMDFSLSLELNNARLPKLEL